jgi:hypothetical protein
MPRWKDTDDKKAIAVIAAKEASIVMFYARG